MLNKKIEHQFNTSSSVSSLGCLSLLWCVSMWLLVPSLISGTIRCLWPVLMSRSRSHDTRAADHFMELLNIDWEHGTGVGVTRLLWLWLSTKTFVTKLIWDTVTSCSGMDTQLKGYTGLLPAWCYDSCEKIPVDNIEVKKTKIPSCLLYYSFNSEDRILDCALQDPVTLRQTPG